jgi:Tol biopolymer transport system component
VALSPGTRLGAYQIVAAIGAGGMGEVYRAHDSTLDRDVAIKVLPEAFAADAERLARFEREARVLASLNHPNIATIHGLERSGATAFLIMEMAAGDTLAARIKRSPLPVDEAIAVATQIAAALEAAHEKGIVHRDLKPANVVVSPHGKVKVLDFGLAKALSQDGPAIDVSLSPTMAHAGTLAGVVLGTAAYMSPEQARGKSVDKRADIWAFGCVLYEMLTGRQAFAGDTLTDIIAAVVKNEPDWTTLPADTPRGVRSVLARCLKKDPAHRLRDIADAQFALYDEQDEPHASTTVASAPRRANRSAVVPWAFTAALTLLAGFLLARSWRATDGAAGQPVTRLELSPPTGVELYNGDAQDVALAPDGRRVAFVGVRGGVRQVYVRRFDQFDAVPIRGTEGAFSCFFSPTSDAIGFISTNRSLKKVTLADGFVATLTAADADYTMGSAWGPDDRITFGREATLWQIAATGGSPTHLTTLDTASGELAHAFPAMVGRTAILFTSITANRKARIEAVSLATGQRHVVVESGTLPMYASSGHLIFFRDEALLAAPFDADSLTVTGPPIRIIEILGMGTGGAPLVAIAGSGSFVYATSATTANTLVWVSRQGAEEKLSTTRRIYFSPHLAPDGRRIVVQASGDLWIQDTQRATFTRLTSQTFGNSFPVWTPDGKRVAFRTISGLHWADVEGSDASHAIPGTSIGDFPSSMAPDGDTLLINRQAPNTSQDIYGLSIRSGAVKPLVTTPAFEGGAQFSPDGRWMAYVSDESGQMQVYVRPYPAMDRRWPVSTEGGTSPMWNGNGRELFYRNGNKMMAVEMTPGPELALSAPRLLFEQPYAYGQTITLPNYDVRADGQRFLMVKEEAGSGRLNVVLNWFEELKRLAPTTK